jgi:arylsulfatase A-like enzyme
MKYTTLTALLLAPLAALHAAAPQKPNILFIMADDLGYSDLGCYGSEIDTPVLDRLAANGLRFTNFHSTGRCWPSRTAVVTGYYPQQTNTDPGGHGAPLPPFAKPVTDYLRELGYRNYHSGKVHFANSPIGRPGPDGKIVYSKALSEWAFDRSYAVENHNNHFSSKGNDLDGQPVPESTDPGYYSAIDTAGRAIEFLGQHFQEHSGQPFFLQLTFIAPHFPLHALPEDIAKYRERYRAGWDKIREARYQKQKETGITTAPLSKRMTDFVNFYGWDEDKLKEALGPNETASNAFWKDLPADVQAFQAEKMAVHAAMVDRIDQEIGRLVAMLEKQGVLDNTIILFVSDNGATSEQMVRGGGHDPKAPLGSAASYLCLGPGWATTCNTPFRFSKAYVHEGGVASPLLVHWPAGIQDKGALRQAFGHFVDLLPTLVTAAGGTPGNNLQPGWPALPGKNLLPAFAKDVPVERDAIYFSHARNEAIIQGDWKAVRAQMGPWELYNLKADRVEENNLAAQNPEILQRLTARHEQFDAQFAKDRDIRPPNEAAPAAPAGKKAKKSAPKSKHKELPKEAGGAEVFNGTNWRDLGSSPALTPENNVRWSLEAWIDAACPGGAILMGNRAPGDAGAFFKIVPDRGIQLFQDGKILFRIPVTLPREQWTRVEVVKTGARFEVMVDGSPAGSAEVQTRIPPLPVYLGGEPGQKFGDSQFALAKIRNAAVSGE